MRKESLVLVVVDIQEKLLPSIYNADEVVANSNKAMRLCDIYGIPVILTEQYPKGLGRTVDEVLEVFNSLGVDKYKVEKMTFSCAREPSFTDILSQEHKKGRLEVVLTGIEAHICVYQTAMDLKDLGYKVYLLSDATGSRKRENHTVILDHLRSKGVEVIPTETFIFQILERAGTEEFKRMLPYLK